jgi:hypothetical protein
MLVVRDAQKAVFDTQRLRARARDIVAWLTRSHPEVAGPVCTDALVRRAESALRRAVSLGFERAGDAAGFVALCLAHGDDLAERDDTGPMLRDRECAADLRLARAAAWLARGGAP